MMKKNNIVNFNPHTFRRFVFIGLCSRVNGCANFGGVFNAVYFESCICGYFNAVHLVKVVGGG